MSQKIQGILAHAFEATFHDRVISEDQPVKSLLFAILGWQEKFRLDRGTLSYPDTDNVEQIRDRNIYNWIEQFLFSPLRIAKNLVKLFAEFLPRVLAVVFLNPPFFPLHILSYILAASFMMIAKLSQSVLSPFAALKTTFAVLESRNKALAYVAATLHGLVIVGLYAGLAAFAWPALAAAASGTFLAPVVTGLNLAINWLGNLPVMASVGSTLASALHLGSALAAAALVATVVAAPLLAGLKVALRYFSPFKPDYLSGGPSIHARLKVEAGNFPQHPVGQVVSSSWGLNSSSKASIIHYQTHNKTLHAPRNPIQPLDINDSTENNVYPNPNPSGPPGGADTTPNPSGTEFSSTISNSPR